MTDQEAWVALNAINGLNALNAMRLAEFFQSPAAVFEANTDALVASGVVNAITATNIVNFSKDKFIASEYNLVRRKGVTIITLADDNYPPLLKTIIDPPPVLYIEGNAEILSQMSLAIVGSRACSPYGKRMANAFGCAFAEEGFVVTSGLARGIDTAAHEGCLKGNGKTIAVMGCGLNDLYPKENAELRRLIVGQQGAIVSELPMDTVPLPIYFPRRNRVVTGLSTATVVIEAGLKSGALISANFASQQGREVFVVPGAIDAPFSEGSNRLIRDGAAMALSAVDVMQAVGSQMQMCFSEAGSNKEVRINLTTDEHQLYEHIYSEPIHVDELSKICQESSQASALLLSMELKGVIEQLPGRYYVRCR